METGNYFGRLVRQIDHAWLCFCLRGNVDEHWKCCYTEKRNRYFSALIYSRLPIIRRNYCCVIFVHLIRQLKKKQIHPFWREWCFSEGGKKFSASIIRIKPSVCKLFFSKLQAICYKTIPGAYVRCNCGAFGSFSPLSLCKSSRLSEVMIACKIHAFCPYMPCLVTRREKNEP